MAPAEQVPTVVIVGGGYTGAAVAFHLARAFAVGAPRVLVVEPRGRLGGGLAYSTHDPVHRINVPAGRMSLFSDAPSHFADWLAATHALADDPEAITGEGLAYPRRHVFGRYVAEQLDPLLASGAIAHVRDEVVSIDERPGRFQLTLAHGADISADILVLATSHPAPAVPRPLRQLAGLPGFVADIHGSCGLGSIAPDDRVLLIGNGLTAADAIASLDSAGHRGRILALSRRGLRSRGHAVTPAEPRGDFSSLPARTALALLRRIRREVAAAAGEGITWHAVFDALREQAPAIWSALAQAERARLVRHLRVFWDVHRYRAAPQVVAVADRRIADGTLTVAAGRLLSAERHGMGFEIGYRLRGAPSAEHQRFDCIAVTTGPDHGTVTDSNPAIASLAARGNVRVDALRLGLDVSGSARAIDRHGRELPNLFVAGPLARATVGELMGLPQVTRHAERVAAEVARMAAASVRRAG
ncbi:FAD/NAD(P)-binding protein [Kumtagia ephedrae]|uniref:Hydroxyacylglutathione hydrolase n=1 Tax=Kumtagia ephedrae TaxID=2116701 RepID=A0A2P7S427_9HYPH|nr:FAD/NAD(P)-binding protein [Mesorhizobium ephedrae]PSJ57236.1 hydroxyacylglutathione hydrolase [Mesorhizobium ephedrae]